MWAGKADGYYGCSGRRRRLCDNRLTVRRSLVESILLGAICDRLLEPGAVYRVLQSVVAEIRKLSSAAGGQLDSRRLEYRAARKRLDRLVEFVAGGHAPDSAAVAEAIAQAEARVSQLSAEIDALDDGRRSDLRSPSVEWVAERVLALKRLLERRTVESARVLRRLLGEHVVLEPVTPDSGVGTTLPGLPLMCSCSLSRPGLLVVRTVVRDLCVGGGGGSRTRVRKYVSAELYMLVRP